jgi:hypothetical protein
VAGAAYTVNDGGGHVPGTAASDGTLTAPISINGGDLVTLDNSASRTLTSLHVAHLKVNITGVQSVLASGTCEAGDYFAAPLSSAPTNGFAGAASAVAGGAALTGAICPLSGDATGFPSSPIVQTDEFSGGATTTAVPDVENTSPIQGEIVYGPFTVLAESGLPGPNNTVIPTDATSTVNVAITPSAGGPPVFTSGNVDTIDGLPVPALAPGTYSAKWLLTDANGDTRVVTTRFIEEPGAAAVAGLRGPAGPQGKPGVAGPTPTISCTIHHNQITCTVTFKKARDTKGTVSMRISRGGHMVALGRARISRGKASLRMRELRRNARGRWTITLVLSRPGQPTMTASSSRRVL